MKTSISLLLLILVWLFSVSAFADSVSSLTVATATLIKPKDGKIQIYRGNINQTFSSPVELQEEDLVTSSPDQIVLITLREGSLVTLAPASGVEVSKVAAAATVAGSVGSTTLRIDSGLADFQAAKIYKGNTRFRVKSKDATLSVRGTEFIAEQDSREVSLHTVSGSVEFESVGRPNDARIVKAGESTFLMNGALSPTQVTHFDKAEFEAYLKRRSGAFVQQIAKTRNH
jgi:ferric-dicitrate binding protein FerR (iron transport regulator)